MNSRATARTAGAFWVAAALVYLAGEAVTAAAFPGYSYATNYISDLGVPEVGEYQGRFIDSPLSLVMNIAFVASGALFFAAAILAFRATATGPRKTFLVLSGIYGIGIAVVGLIHGSQASADSGLGAFHVIGAAMAIIGGNLVAITASVASRRPNAGYSRVALALGVVGLVALVMLQVDSRSADVTILPDGIWERIAVYTVTAWQLLTGIQLLASRKVP